MGKKGKVNKLAKMSDEERARYLQHRADMEEEARRRKHELVAKFIKMKLEKEEAYSKINTAKLNQMWRFFLRRIKCKQMEKEITNMMATFNFLVERKDRQIAGLVRAVDSADNQHRRAFQAHTEALSYFLNIGAQRLDKIQNEFENQKNILLDGWDLEEQETGEKQESAEFKLILITYINDTEFKTYTKDKELEMASAKNDAKLEHQEDLLAFARPKEKEIEYYWTRLREVYNGYLEQHNPIISHYRLLMEKDEFYQRDIARNDKQIIKAAKELINLQKEYNRTTDVIEAKVERMLQHKDELSKKYWQMKKNYKLQQQRSSEQMIVLVEASQSATERLEELMKKIEKIQQMSDICSRYERDEDKVLKSRQNWTEDGQLHEYDHMNEEMMKEFKQFNKMDKFLLKINRVQVQTMCLKTEKSKLMRENQQLKYYMKTYLTDLALKNGKDRPVSVKTISDNHAIKGTNVNRPVTCIEGGLSNAVLHEKRMKVFAKKNKEQEIRSYPRMQNWMSS